LKRYNASVEAILKRYNASVEALAVAGLSVQSLFTADSTCLIYRNGTAGNTYIKQEVSKGEPLAGARP